MPFGSFGSVTGLAIAAVAGVEIFAAYLEMIGWGGAYAAKVFSFVDAADAGKTALLAFNMGLYNLLLAAGLIWALFIGHDVWAAKIARFFLALVLVAGVVGELSVTKGEYFFIRPFIFQYAPAALALALLHLDWPKRA